MNQADTMPLHQTQDAPVRSASAQPAQPAPAQTGSGALADPSRMRRTLQIGAILVANGKLRPEQVDAVLAAQQSSGLRFGEQAIRLRLVSQADVEEALSLQFGYSSSRATALALPDKVTAAVNPFSPFAEALRGLRSQLMLRWFDGTPERSALAITSVNRGDGKSFVVANLGVAFSQIGERTLIIDADLRHPTQHLNFGLRNYMGLSGILSGRAGFEEVSELPTLPNLSVLPSGPQPPNPQELLSRPEFVELLRMLYTRYDVILLDTPSAQESSDSLVVAQRAGAAMIVGRKDRTKTSDLSQLGSIITSHGVSLLGATLNEY